MSNPSALQCARTLARKHNAKLTEPVRGVPPSDGVWLTAPSKSFAVQGEFRFFSKGRWHWPHSDPDDAARDVTFSSYGKKALYYVGLDKKA